MTENQDNKNNLFHNVLLILVGSLGTLFATQFFYKENKQTETKIGIIKEQVENLNRILNFSYRYREAILTIGTIEQYRERIKYVDEKTGKVIKIGNGDIIKKDTIFSTPVNIPLFVCQEKDRKEFDVKLNEILKAKNQVEHNIAIQIDELNFFLEKYPLPKIQDKQSIINSKWTKKEVRDGWYNVLSKLYEETSSVMRDNGFM